MLNKRLLLAALLVVLTGAIGAGQSPQADYDIIIRNGVVYDGTGGAPRRADVGVKGDQIAAVGDLSKAGATNEVDAGGMAVAPGFINMLSHSETSLIADYRSLGELRQGVTTQIFGESSMGPLSEEMKRTQRASQGDIKFDIPWTTLAEYLQYVEKRGISQNVASFVGAGTLRSHVIGLEDKPPTPAQLEQMKELLRREMEAGALGVTTARSKTCFRQRSARSQRRRTHRRKAGSGAVWPRQVKSLTASDDGIVTFPSLQDKK